MGELAAEILLKRIGAGARRVHAKRITVEPELVARGSTAIVNSD
jgi:DNA-binding LacI/PurR family transcriptional regulator